MFSRASSNPMCAEAVRELPDGGAWTYEAKLDDYRCLAAKRTGGVVLWSRRGNEFTARFPEISRRVCEKLPSDTLIDGEMIAIDENGQTLEEERAIATGLNDVDALLGALDRLIAKKRDLKQAAMQQLLTWRCD
jgi:ATP-dependent DNA ligase